MHMMYFWKKNKVYAHKPARVRIGEVIYSEKEPVWSGHITQHDVIQREKPV